MLGAITCLSACASTGQAAEIAARPAAHLVETIPKPAGASTPCDECLAERPDVRARAGTVGGDAITVDAAQRFQTMDGFGFAMTDTSAYLIDQVPNDRGQRDELLRRLFDPVQGIGISWMRITLGASDFTVAPPPWYSYQPTQADAFDVGRPRTGSPRGDYSHIIPLLAQANLLGKGGVTFFADPHSAPAWMKHNGVLHNFFFGRNSSCILGYCKKAATTEDVRNDYVQYFVDFVKTYDAHGVPIAQVGVQNEPGSNADFPAGEFTPAAQVDFISRLKREMASQIPRLAPKVMAESTFPGGAEDILAKAANPKRIDGVAYHCYFLRRSQRASIMHAAAALHAHYPHTPMHETECTQDSQGIWQKTIDVLIDHSRVGASSVAGWNLALDPTGGPHSVLCSVVRDGQCFDTDRSSNMTAPVVISGEPGNASATFTREYYEMGQFTKFVRPGAIRIASNELGPLHNVAFENTDGTTVLVVHNTGETSRRFAVNVGGDRHLTVDHLPAKGIATLTW